MILQKGANKVDSQCESLLLEKDCYRGAEEGHYPVPEELSYCALIAVYLLSEEYQALADQGLYIFGVELFRYGSEPLHVGEEYSDLLALTLNTSTGGEDLVGQVFGGICQGMRIV